VESKLGSKEQENMNHPSKGLSNSFFSIFRLSIFLITIMAIGMSVSAQTPETEPDSTRLITLTDSVQTLQNTLNSTQNQLKVSQDSLNLMKQSATFYYQESNRRSDSLRVLENYAGQLKNSTQATKNTQDSLVLAQKATEEAKESWKIRTFVSSGLAILFFAAGFLIGGKHIP